MARVEIGGAVTERCIEAVVGTLLNDEQLRDEFLNDPHRALFDLLERGTQLTDAEITTVAALDAMVWEQIAEYVDQGCRLAA
jgi:hypothetical protein